MDSKKLGLKRAGDGGFSQQGGAATTGDASRAHGESSKCIKVTPPCGHEHHALFRPSSGDCVLNPASAERAGSETSAVCVPPGLVSTRLKPRKGWNSREGWKVEDM